jgi:hypothetical protein
MGRGAYPSTPPNPQYRSTVSHPWPPPLIVLLLTHLSPQPDTTVGRYHHDVTLEDRSEEGQGELATDSVTHGDVVNKDNDNAVRVPPRLSNQRIQSLRVTTRPLLLCGGGMHRMGAMCDPGTRDGVLVVQGVARRAAAR